MISWSIAGTFCGTITGVLVSSMLWISGQDNFYENMGGGILGGFYGGIPVGVVMGILDSTTARV
jgi:predicted membrane protein